MFIWWDLGKPREPASEPARFLYKRSGKWESVSQDGWYANGGSDGMGVCKEGICQNWSLMQQEIYQGWTHHVNRFPSQFTFCIVDKCVKRGGTIFIFFHTFHTLQRYMLGTNKQFCNYAQLHYAIRGEGDWQSSYFTHFAHCSGNKQLCNYVQLPYAITCATNI